jgi:hypothetical protein
MASTSSPEHTYLLSVFAAARTDEFEKQPIEHRPIITGAVNEPGFYDETAEIDLTLCVPAAEQPRLACHVSRA